MSGLARKFVILVATKTEPMIIVGLVVAILALGALYWFVRERVAQRVYFISTPSSVGTRPEARVLKPR
jgi:hypothetical protein